METFQINRLHHDPLEFEGVLLATATSPQLEAERGTRGFELVLYRHASGGFVVSIEFLTTCPQERRVLQAEVVDEPHDVENVLSAFEPCEHVNQQALRALPDEQRQRLQKRLCRLYDEQVTNILDALSTYQCDGPEAAPPADTGKSAPKQGKSAPKQGILSFLRLK